MPSAPTRPSGRLPMFVSAMLLLGAVLLAMGVGLERHGYTDVHAPGVTESSEQSESPHHDEHEGSAAPGEATHHPREAGDARAPEERPLVSLLESPAAVVTLIVVSIALAVAVWRRPSRLVLGPVVVFAIAAGAFDIAEVGHQLAANHVGLASLAGLIIATRLAVITAAIGLWRSTA